MSSETATGTTVVSPGSEQITHEVRQMLVEALSVPEDAVTEDAALIDDLGAESIDFIDITVRVERMYGVTLPMREWSTFAREQRGQLPMEELAPLIVAECGLTLSAEDRQRLGRFGLKPMADRIEKQHGVVIPETARRSWARKGVEGLATAYERFFAQPIAEKDFERLVELASVDVYAVPFTQALRRLFTVRMLGRFIGSTLQQR
jgi:acyl carrier protein